MQPTILITYASKHGSTRQVAESVARTICEQGLDVDLQPADQVADPGRYAGVVLGTALYMGRPHLDARRFLRRHHAALAGRPLFVFAMGPVKMGADDVAGAQQQLDRALEKVSDVTPARTTIFGGVVDPRKLRFPLNRMEASDARDWPVIEAWARAVGEEIRARWHVAA